MTRTLGPLLTIAAIATIGFLPQRATAQDVLAVAAESNTLLGDTLNARTLLVVFTPGATMPWHDHPVHMIYVIEGGTMKVTSKGKEPVTSELKAGQFMISPPANHMVINSGSTTIKVLVIELTDPMMGHKH